MKISVWSCDTAFMESDDGVHLALMRVVRREDADGDRWEWSVWCGGDYSGGFTVLAEDEAKRRASSAAEVMLTSIGEVHLQGGSA